MAFAIEREETVPAAIARIMDEQIVRAREHLTPPLTEKSVHDARKRFKETRAVIRLVRDPLGEQFSLENAWFRDAGRDLSDARDAQAVIEALEKLSPSRRAIRALEARRDAMPKGEIEGRAANVLQQLVVAQGRVGMWPAMRDEFETIAPGLRRIYRDARNAMRDAERGGMPQQFHEWRKFVKQHWYHVQLLRHVWPALMKPYAASLEELSRLLGDHHDLFMLRTIIAASPAEFGRSATVIRLLDQIEARQTELATKAFEIGRHVFGERPTPWLARMRNHWDAWRA